MVKVDFVANICLYNEVAVWSCFTKNAQAAAKSNELCLSFASQSDANASKGVFYLIFFQ